MRKGLGLVVTLVIAAAAAAAAPTPSADTITPNPAIQSEIARVAAATNDAQVKTSLAKLRELGGPDFSELIPQMVYYLMNAKDLREAMTPGVISNRLQITSTQLRQALARYRGTRDPRLKEQIDNLLQGNAAPEPTPAAEPEHN